HGVSVPPAAGQSIVPLPMHPARTARGCVSSRVWDGLPPSARRSPTRSWPGKCSITGPMMVATMSPPRAAMASRAHLRSFGDPRGHHRWGQRPGGASGAVRCTVHLPSAVGADARVPRHGCDDLRDAVPALTGSGTEVVVRVRRTRRIERCGAFRATVDDLVRLDRELVPAHSAEDGGFIPPFPRPLLGRVISGLRVAEMARKVPIAAEEANS